jgi:hypothetical protein
MMRKRQAKKNHRKREDRISRALQVLRDFDCRLFMSEPTIPEDAHDELKRFERAATVSAGVGIAMHPEPYFPVEITGSWSV